MCVIRVFVYVYVYVCVHSYAWCMVYGKASDLLLFTLCIRMYICTYVCMYVWMCVCMCVYVCDVCDTCICVFVYIYGVWYMVKQAPCYICMYVRMHIGMYTRVHECMHACMYVYTSVRMFVCIYVCMFVCFYKPRQGESSWCATIDQEGVVCLLPLLASHPDPGVLLLLWSPTPVCVSFSSLCFSPLRIYTDIGLLPPCLILDVSAIDWIVNVVRRLLLILFLPLFPYVTFRIACSSLCFLRTLHRALSLF